MSDFIRELCTEAHEIIVNARAALDAGEITHDQYNEVIQNLLNDLDRQRLKIAPLKTLTPQHIYI